MFKQISIILLLTIQLSSSLNNDQGETPLMGWISSQTFKCNIDCDNDPNNCLSEDNIIQIADLMVDKGFLDIGYQYIVLDDCWSASTRDENNLLQADPIRFPNGIPVLVQYIHSRGLKLGISANYGSQTCNGFPGSNDFLQIDAFTFAQWGVDYVKLDACNSDVKSLAYEYPLFGYNLGLTLSPITYFCSWPLYERKAGILPVYEEISSYCNIWQNIDEIENNINSIISTSEFITRNQIILSSVQGPGAFNYAGQLVIGNPGISESDANTQMAIWSIFGSPLLISADLRTIPKRFADILTNYNMVAISQDELGLMGRKIKIVNTYVAVYAKPLLSDETAFAFVNFFQSSDPLGLKIRISLRDLGLTRFASYYLFETFGGNLIGIFQSNESVDLTVPNNFGTFSIWARNAQSSLNQKTNSSSLNIRKKQLFNLNKLH